MAIMIPDKAIYNKSRAEEVVYERLRNQLNDDWLCVHSYNWNHDTDSRESDFILFNKSYGLLVLEIKGGGVYCNNREWGTIDRLGNDIKIRNPYEQAAEGAAKIYKEINTYLKEKNNIVEIKVFRGVCIPDVNERDFNTNNSIIRELTFFRDDFYGENFELKIINMINYLKRCEQWKYKPKGIIDDKTVEIVKEYFCYRVSSKISTDATLVEVKNRILELTEEQKNLLQCIDQNNNVTITGPAGTGKTILAIAKSKSDYLKGKRVLYLYSNNKIKSEVAQITNELDGINNNGSIEVMTLAKYYSSKVNGFTGNFEWAKNEFLKTNILDKWDTIILDEAQSMDKDIIEKLKKIQHTSMYIFYDKNQNLVFGSNNDFKHLELACHFELHKNLRNTNNIVKSAYGLVKIENTNNYCNGIEALDVKIIMSDTFDNIIETIKRDYKEVLYKNPEEIIVLTTSSKSKSVIKNLNNEYCYVECGWLIDEFCAHDLDNGSKDTFECCKKCINNKIYTVREAIGVERDYVIIIDENQSIKEVLHGDELNAKLLYTAISRARFEIVIYSTILNFSQQEIEKVFNSKLILNKKSDSCI